MGGVARKVGEEIKRPFSQDRPAITQIVPGMDEAIRKAGAKSEAGAAAEDAAARRRARRGGRALLSEQRLTPESGVGGQTLGSGPSV